MPVNPLQLRCACGAIEGELSAQAAAGRAVCYCRDCRAAQRWLDPARGLDAAGGVSIIAVQQSRLRLLRGAGDLACLRLSPKGMARWYCPHCRTALGNTPATAGFRFVGLNRTWFPQDDATLDAALGPVRWQSFKTAAIGPVPPLPRSKGGSGLLGVVARTALDRFRRVGEANPFFTQDGQLRASPTVLSLPERKALQALDNAPA